MFCKVQPRFVEATKSASNHQLIKDPLPFKKVLELAQAFLNLRCIDSRIG